MALTASRRLLVVLLFMVTNHAVVRYLHMEEMVEVDGPELPDEVPQFDFIVDSL